MKKPLIFILATVFFGVFVQLGCGIATEKVFTPGELVDRVTADEQGWIGKELLFQGTLGLPRVLTMQTGMH